MTVEETIRAKLEAAFAPESLEIENQSHLHSGHHGSPGTGESHFQVTMTAAAFAGQSRMERQRAVYGVLADEMKGPVHALALTLRAPGES